MFNYTFYTRTNYTRATRLKFRIKNNFRASAAKNFCKHHPKISKHLLEISFKFCETLQQIMNNQARFQTRIKKKEPLMIIAGSCIKNVDIRLGV